MEFSPGAGLVLAPNAEMRWTNMLDYWTISWTNSLGFLDREPPAPELAQASCHVAFVGDSFVEAISVSVADKLPVRLEELAAERLPHLDVTTSAYGIRGTGQIAQLPWYDKWMRRLRPKLVVLVFVDNDYRDNTGATLWANFVDLEHPPTLTAIKEDDGRITLRSPTPEWQAFLRLNPLILEDRLPFSYWFKAYQNLVAWRFWVVDGAPPRTSLPPPGGLEFTAFALDQWSERAEIDGTSLAILTYFTRGEGFSKGLARLAEARDIPVIDQAEWILDSGAEFRDVHWEHDNHWNPQGHQWAAEAVLAWLDRHQSVCGE